MPRRKSATKRVVLPDPKYGEAVVTQFINGLMRRGKKSLAEDILYNAFDLIEKDSEKPGLEVFKKRLKALEEKAAKEGIGVYRGTTSGIGECSP